MRPEITQEHGRAARGRLDGGEPEPFRERGNAPPRLRRRTGTASVSSLTKPGSRTALLETVLRDPGADRGRRREEGRPVELPGEHEEGCVVALAGERGVGVDEALHVLVRADPGRVDEEAAPGSRSIAASPASSAVGERGREERRRAPRARPRAPPGSIPRRAASAARDVSETVKRQRARRSAAPCLSRDIARARTRGEGEVGNVVEDRVVQSEERRAPARRGSTCTPTGRGTRRAGLRRRRAGGGGGRRSSCFRPQPPRRSEPRGGRRPARSRAPGSTA